jgi:hypothetical protein
LLTLKPPEIPFYHQKCNKTALEKLLASDVVLITHNKLKPLKITLLMPKAFPKSAIILIVNHCQMICFIPFELETADNHILASTTQYLNHLADKENFNYFDSLNSKQLCITKTM